MPNPPVRMVDIARKLGISVVTVSKALAGKDGVGKELKDKIIAAALEMGYQKKQVTYQPKPDVVSIGIVLAERLRRPEHSFYWALYISLMEAFKTSNFLCFLETISDQDESTATLPQFVQQHQVSGVVVLGAIQKHYLQTLASQHIPLVLLDHYCDDLAAGCVVTDSLYGGYEMTRHLLTKGHRRIGYVGSIHQNMNAQDRYYGYCKALERAGIAVREDWVIADRSADGFLQQFALPEDMPTAFFCSCDQSAYHFIKDLQRRGYCIPEQISVVGFYDHIFATLLEPQLTTFRIDMTQMAAVTVSLLKSLMRGEERSLHAVVSGMLVERKSVRTIL